MLRRQEGCSNMMGVSGLHPGLWAYCEGATLPPALGGVVPRQWAQCALLWFQRSQLQPPALCSTASTHNTTKPNPEVKIRNLSSLLLCIFFLITRGEREGKPVPLTQTLQLWLEKKDKGWRIPLCSPLSAGSILMTFPPSVSITWYTSSTQGFPLFSLIRNFRIFFTTKWETTFLVLSCLPVTFLSAKIFHKSLPTDGNRRALLGPGRRVRAGAVLRKQQAVPKGEGKSALLQGSNHKASTTRAGTHWALCGVWDTASLHRTLSTRSSFLWSHSRTMMGEDWACPMRETLLQSPAEPQSPEVRKWRHLTWWGEENIKKSTPKSIKKVTAR